MSRSIPYRPEIDGLRTIAVLSVVIYHARFLVDGRNILPGGFLGVDIFFVISGYLIASIVLNDIREDRFSFRAFYERRARRILPILLFVMLVSLPFAWYFLLADEFIDYSYQLITSIFFSSNIYFWLQDSYWATNSALKPFLHTWSLGIEEQFYLFMPLLLLGLYRFQREHLFRWILGLGVVSLVYAHWGSAAYPQQSFFLLPSRAWELLAGALVACARPPQDPARRLLTRWLPEVGVLLILSSFFWFSEKTLHPSFLTVIPLAGTMFVIHYATPASPAVALLRTRAFVALGLLSYGIYIWHFPAFAFLRMAREDSPVALRLGMVVLVIALSSLSYFTIERPFRRASTIPGKVFFPTIAAAIIFIVTFSVMGLQDGFRSRLPELLHSHAKPADVEDHVWFNTAGPVKGRIILVGDSHFNSIAPTMKDWALKAGYDFAKSGFDGCQLLVETVRVSMDDRRPGRCNPDFQDGRMDFVVNSPESHVILGGRLPLVLEESRFDNREGGSEGELDGEMDDFIQDAAISLETQAERQELIKRKYQETVRRILDAGHVVVLVYPIPEVGWHVPRTLRRRIGRDIHNAREVAEESPVTTSYEVFRERTQSSYAILDTISGDRVIRIYPERLFCNTEIEGRCVTHDLDMSYYRDDDHLSEYGSLKLVDYIQEEIAQSRR